MHYFRGAYGEAMRNETFCPRLWSEVYIDQKGDVFACCHCKPQAVGNIYKEKLEVIYNNRIIQRLRQRSLSGQLGCFAKCTLLDKKRKASPREKLIISYRKDLKRLKILFGELCNINCIMCWQDHKNRECLDYVKLVENVDITPFERVEIQGGEPLFIPAAKLFFEYAASKRKKVSFLTNGLLVNDEWADKLALYSSFVYFSINAATKKTHELVNRGSRWEVVLRNIQRIHKAREKHGTRVKVKGHMTVVRENTSEVPLFISRFKQLGFDQIEFSFDGQVPVFLRANPLMMIKLRLAIKKALACSKYRSAIDLRCLTMLKLV